MRSPKILAVASAVDLDFRYGCTPAWWQLWKGMYEAGIDLIVTPYRGRPVDSMVAHVRESGLPRGRVVRARTGRGGASEGRPLPAPRRGQPGRHDRRQGRPRGDLALGD